MLANSRVATMLPVSDLQRARTFYEDTLGFKPMFESDELIGYGGGGDSGFAVYVSGGRADGSFTQLAFTVRDFDTEIADLRERGITFEEYDMPGLKTVDGVADLDGERTAWFKDPDGNTLAVGSDSQS